ncbi:MAG: hypothetical protein FWF03_00730 [Defluviitaleaceae bacterium]|nr:hypothetical protein [Defluviitaleaceae bacterium]
MELRFVDRDTPVTIMVCNRSEETIGQHRGRFYDLESRVSILLECEPLSQQSNELPGDAYLKIELFSGPRNNQRLYGFNGKLMGKAVREDKPLLIVNQTSEFKQIERAKPRIEMSVAVKAYTSLSNTGEGEPEAKGVSINISADGLGLLSNDLFEKRDSDHQYALSFALGKLRTFILPSRLQRRREGTQLVQYKYEYGFVFDFTGRENDRSRLITAMLAYQLERV